MKEMYAWIKTVQEHLPHLSKPQAKVLALWSFGISLVKSSSLSAVSLAMAGVLGKRENTVRQCLREWYWEREQKSGHKRGKPRDEIEAQSCFVHLLRWVLSLWKGKYLALGIDATNLSDRFVVLAVCVLYRGCAIPVAWTVLYAGRKGQWRREWLRMLRLLHRAVPCGMQVMVLADRGLYAPWLFRRICRLGWRPMLRVNLSDGAFQPEGASRYYSFLELTPEKGSLWRGRGVAFKKKGSRLTCTLLAWWAPQAKEPWIILTDLSPEGADAGWYALRSWIEHCFKFMKREGWQWHRTRMRDPARAERIWLALSLATLEVVSLGADEGVEEPHLESLSMASEQEAPSKRKVSPFRRGWIRLILALILGHELPKEKLTPEPLPKVPIFIDHLHQSKEKDIVYDTAA